MTAQDRLAQAVSVQWFWIAKLPSGVLLLSEVFDDWDECYTAYVANMTALQQDGMDIAQMKFRGVFDAEQATELVTDHMQGDN